MNNQRYLIAGIGAAIFMFIYGWVVQGILLSDFWAANMPAGSMRPDDEVMLWAIAVSCLLQGLALGYIFVKGYEGLGIGEGFRFGLLIAWFIFAMYIMWYALSPMTNIGFVVGVLTDGIMYIGAGVVLAALYKR